jgi:prepilin-type N-terminal cleavage/methylation domain-containing protein
MKTQAAFTLIELMVTLVATFIMVMWAVPNMRSVLLNNRITTKTNELIRTINYARSEAIIRNGATIQIQAGVFDDNGEAIADVTLPANNEWGHGWRLWVDINNDNILDPQDVVKVFEFKNDQIIVDDPQNNDPQMSPLQYLNRGRVLNPYLFYICNPKHSQGRLVRVRPTGRVQSERCSLDGASGNQCPFSCE